MNNIVLQDNLDNTMVIGKYYNVGNLLNLKYLGSSNDPQPNTMRFQRYDKGTIRRSYNPFGPRAIRVFPDEEHVWTDDEFDKNEGGGGRRKFKSKSKKRKSKRRKNKSNRSR
jgi:hypothetical protein